MNYCLLCIWKTLCLSVSKYESILPALDNQCWFCYSLICDSNLFVTLLWTVSVISGIAIGSTFPVLTVADPLLSLLVGYNYSYNLQILLYCLPDGKVEVVHNTNSLLLVSLVTFLHLFCQRCNTICPDSVSNEHPKIKTCTTFRSAL